GGTSRAGRAGGCAHRPFRILIGRPFYVGSPADGVFLEVGFPPHVTIIHPRTSRRGELARAERARRCLGASFTIDAAAITAWDGDRWPPLRPLPGRAGRTRLAGALQVPGEAGQAVGQVAVAPQGRAQVLGPCLAGLPALAQ